MTYELRPIGTVNVNESAQSFTLSVQEDFREGLQQLEHFSHALVFWWADKHDNKGDRQIVTAKLPYAPGVTAGVFACRSEYRPNPIAMTICPIHSIDADKGVVHLAFIDAFDGTPLLDIKPYIPVCERIRDFAVPQWFQEWPEWQEDAAAFFSEE